MWRISNYASLDGTGGLLASGRWHSKGRPVVYCTEHPATALLENLVHIEIDAEDRPEQFQVLKISGPDSLSLDNVDKAELAADWRENLSKTQTVGDAWLSKGRSLLLKVLSVLVPETFNVLVNPMHRQARMLRIVKMY